MNNIQMNKANKRNESFIRSGEICDHQHSKLKEYYTKLN